MIVDFNPVSSANSFNELIELLKRLNEQGYVWKGFSFDEGIPVSNDEMFQVTVRFNPSVSTRLCGLSANFISPYVSLEHNPIDLFSKLEKVGLSLWHYKVDWRFGVCKEVVLFLSVTKMNNFDLKKLFELQVGE